MIFISGIICDPRTIVTIKRPAGDTRVNRGWPRKNCPSDGYYRTLYTNKRGIAERYCTMSLRNSWGCSNAERRWESIDWSVGLYRQSRSIGKSSVCRRDLRRFAARKLEGCVQPPRSRVGFEVCVKCLLEI